jgi:hypothetical protein
MEGSKYAPSILVWRLTQAPHCAIKPWAQDVEYRGYKCGSHVLVGDQYRRVLKDKPSIIEVLLINHNLNNRKLSKASSLKLSKASSLKLESIVI